MGPPYSLKSGGPNQPGHIAGASTEAAQRIPRSDRPAQRSRVDGARRLAINRPRGEVRQSLGDIVLAVLSRDRTKSSEISTLGRVAEWFKAPVLKTGVPARVPWVRIPPLPPASPLFPLSSKINDAARPPQAPQLHPRASWEMSAMVSFSCGFDRHVRRSRPMSVVPSSP